MFILLAFDFIQDFIVFLSLLEPIALNTSDIIELGLECFLSSLDLIILLL